MSFQIFISYRRATGDDFSRGLYERLINEGYEVFLDVEKMEAGELDEQIKRNIEESDIFMPLLTERFYESKWVSMEIEYALKKKPSDKIVPVIHKGYDMNSILPVEISKVIGLNGVELENVTFNYGIDKIKELMKIEPLKPSKIKNNIEVISSTIVPNNLNNFIGRKKLIEDITELSISSEKPVVLLNGIGGIGKTMINQKIYYGYLNRTICDDTKTSCLAWVNYEGSLVMSLKNAFEDELGETDDKDVLKSTKKLIKPFERSLIMFLDNANKLTTNEIEWISSLECRVLITSRREYSAFEKINISELSPEDCLKLYKKHSGVKDNKQDETIKEIIKTVDYHTLTVVLIAKTQHESGYSAEKLLEIIKTNGLELGDITDEVALDGTEEYMQMYAILEKVFNLTVINDEEQLRVLTLFSLLADNTAVHKLKLREWFGIQNSNSLNALVRYGWLTEGEENRIYIHPVIAEVVRKKMKPDFSYAETMIRKIVKEIQGTEIVKEKSDILPHLMSIEKGIEKKESHTMAVLYNNIGYELLNVALYTKALEYYNKALAIVEKVLGTENPNTAATYNNIAGLYKAQGDYSKALEYYEKDLAIKEKVLGTEHSYTKTIYKNLAMLYMEMGDIKTSFEYAVKSGLFGSME